MITLVENNPDEAWKIIQKLPKANKQAHVIGITGSPGAGKSTLTSKLVKDLSEKHKIGIIAVDPSSPFSGGAFLGDRIRMRHLSGENVYIRSVASRGSVGGLCDSIYDIVDVMNSFGFEKIIIETVGAGQSEVEVVYVADTILLVMSPDSGDEVQMFKAGIMEIADIYVVNKNDLPEASGFLAQLKNTLALEYEEKSKRKIFSISALKNDGLDELMEDLLNHKDKLIEEGLLKDRIIRRRKRRARSNIIRKIDLFVKNYDPDTKDLFEIKKDIISEISKEEFNEG
jgi:LAO/AO transport system kinase